MSKAGVKLPSLTNNKDVHLTKKQRGKRFLIFYFNKCKWIIDSFVYIIFNHCSPGMPPSQVTQMGTGAAYANSWSSESPFGNNTEKLQQKSYKPWKNPFYTIISVLDSNPESLNIFKKPTEIATFPDEIKLTVVIVNKSFCSVSLCN